MPDFRQFVAALKDEIGALALRSWKDAKDAAARDGEAFVAKVQQDLNRWTELLAQRKLTQDDFAWLVKGKQDLEVAIKVLRPEFSVTLAAERFLREIRIASDLHHPNILPLFDSGRAGDLFYYIMPYVAGETLRGRLLQERQLSIPNVLQITREIADALAYAHGRGIVHRDVKPENIL